MKNRTIDFTCLTSHPVPVTSLVLVRDALTALEATLISGQHDTILLLLEQELMEALSLLVIERFLQYTQCQRVLLLVSPKRKAALMERWMHSTSAFSVTPTSQKAQDAQVCLVTVFEIQTQIGVDARHPFFKTFDLVIFSDVPANPGPVGSQIVELFAAFGTRVIGLSSLLSEEDGELFFGTVIDTKSFSGYQVQ